MNITLDIKCPELAQAINNLAAAMSIRSVDSALQDIVKPAEKPKAGKPSTGTGSGCVIPLTTEPVVGIDAEPATAPEQEALPETATGVDYTQVKAAVLKVSQEKGRAAAVELLGEFDAKVGGDLTEAQWGPFLARAHEVLG